MRFIMLTRRAFAGVVGSTICGLTNLATTSAAAQTPVRAKAIDPKIQRILRTRNDRRRFELDILRGNVRVPSVATADGTPVVATKRVHVELTEDRIPDAFRAHRWNRIVDRFYTVELPLDELERLLREPGVAHVEAGRPLRPDLDISRREIRADPAQITPGGVPGLDGNGVIVGIIDGEMDFTLKDFRDASGAPRIAFLWDQNLIPDPALGEAWPANFHYGVEYDAAAIDRALKHTDPFSVVRCKVSAESHGTHVAGIAVGNGKSFDKKFPIDRYVGVAPAATIIFVDYKRSKNTEMEDDTRLSDAISYIFEKADDLCMPCVVNISQGRNTGSHDGQSFVERAIDELLTKKAGRVVIKSAGNLHDDRGHASGTLEVNKPRKLAWRVRRGDTSFNEIEIWHSSRDSVRVRLIRPSGVPTTWVTVGHPFDQTSTTTRPSISIDAVQFANPPGNNSCIQIELDAGTRSAMPLGDWTIEIEALQILQDGRFDAWIDRDEGTRTQFLGSDFDEQRTLSTPGTGHQIITVANYDHLVFPPEINRTSGRGRTRDGRVKPEVAAPGTDILSSCSLGGRIDCRTGKPIPMRIKKTGTSMAAPHVAGAIALILQRHPNLTAEKIRQALIDTAVREPGVNDFRIDFGYGRVDIARCLQHLGP
jgi:subtilisin family serine protease